METDNTQVIKKVDRRSTLRTITSNKFITAMGLEKMTLKARKLLYIAAAQCKKNDQEFYTYEITVREFAEMMGIEPEGVYAAADELTDELLRTILRIAPKGKNVKEYDKYSIFSNCKYKDGVISFTFNHDMTSLLLGLQEDFTKPLLRDFTKMRSPYSMAIWHLMQREMNSKKPTKDQPIVFDIQISELRMVTDTVNKFKNTNDLKRNIFDKALREIRTNCGVDIQYTNISEKGKRTIIAFHCIATLVEEDPIIDSNFVEIKEK